MARKRTQKTVSARIDRTYIDRPHRWRRFRLSMVFAATAAAILFVALATVGGKGELIHNPGRLTFVHAKFQNDCAACHTGTDEAGRPTGKFSKLVSDSACLKCHDAGIHNANQSTMVTLDKRRTPPVVRSADCTVCHVEHRGQTNLVSTADALCLNCHSDLTGKTIKPVEDAAKLKVSAFTIEGHPHFGGALMVGNKRVDPTNLRFNHKKHLQGAIDEKHKDMRSCTFCHDPSPSAGDSLVWENGKTSYCMPGGSKLAVPEALQDGSARHRSMTQINYAKDCKVCHDLGTFPNSDRVIPHAPMSEVRTAILAYITDSSAPWQKYAKDAPGAKEKPLNDRIISKLSVADFPGASDAMDAVTKAVKTAPLSPQVNLADVEGKLPADIVVKLAAAVAKLPTNNVPAADRVKVAAAVSSTTRPMDHLRPLVVAKLRDEVVKGLSGEAKQKILTQFDAAFARFNQEAPDPRLLEIYVAFANEGGANCIKCHDVEGDAAAVAPEWSTLATNGKPVTVAANAPVFRTKPTAIPAGPRRWYVNSEFDHDAHRSMNCVECHNAALTSEKTSDVLSPDIQWDGMAFKPGSTTEMVKATRSCVECHHPDNSQGPGAASNCTECHVYHDRTHESAPKPTPDDVLTGKPAPAAPVKQVAAAGQ